MPRMKRSCAAMFGSDAATHAGHERQARAIATSVAPASTPDELDDSQTPAAAPNLQGAQPPLNFNMGMGMDLEQVLASESTLRLPGEVAPGNLVNTGQVSIDAHLVPTSPPTTPSTPPEAMEEGRPMRDGSRPQPSGFGRERHGAQR